MTICRLKLNDIRDVVKEIAVASILLDEQLCSMSNSARRGRRARSDAASDRKGVTR
jgi:hypothetical protein